MAKELRCGDVVEGCDYVVRAETEQELMETAASHAREAHGLNEIDEATAAKVRAQIREV